jgi:hypothetical protein
MGAQFASALADNALLIVSIALLEARGLPGWWAPLLKVGLIAAYVAFAPWVGPLADGFAKGRVMAAMNVVKALGLLAMLVGLHPVLAMAMVGLGAGGRAAAKARRGNKKGAATGSAVGACQCLDRDHGGGCGAAGRCGGWGFGERGLADVVGRAAGFARSAAECLWAVERAQCLHP